MRKFAIGIASLAIVLGVFVLYSRIDKTPPINADAGPDLSGMPFDSNSSDANAMGRIGDMGIGTAEEFEFITRNPETGEIDRRFGFQKLLHTEGDYWQLEQPYMNIYRKDFTCTMKAEQGVVHVEKIGEDTIPKDATFNGNVKINIDPGKSRSIEKSTIYLDNLAFISEKSELSTSGNLRFDSNTVQLSGSGMELIYNNDLERLEFFRVVDVNSLKVKIRRSTLGTVSQNAQTSGTDGAEGANINPAGATGSQEADSTANKYYTCLFSRNVRIDTPDERVFASEGIQIDDIIWSEKTPDETAPEESAIENEPNDPNRIIEGPNKPYDVTDEPNDPNNLIDGLNNTSRDAEEPNDPSHVIDKPNDPYRVAEETGGSESIVAEPDAPNQVVGEPNNPEHITDGPVISVPDPNDLIDVVITCDNGFIVTPKDSRRLNEFKDSARTLTNIEQRQAVDETEKTTLKTQNIELTTLEGDSVATGQTELTFYVHDTNNPDPNLQLLPVKIASQEGAEFLKSANQVVFKGDSLCSIPQKELSEERYATFASPMLIARMPETGAQRTSSLPDIIAIGPARLVFYVEDSNAAAETQKILPVKITSQEKALFLPDMNQVIFDKDCLCEIGSEETGREQYVSLKSSNLKIDLPAKDSSQSFAFSDITAAGPVDLKFYMKDPNNMGTPQALLPVNITARNQARYLSATRQIQVDGSCRSSMRRDDADFVQELDLLSDTMTVDLPNDANAQSPTSSLTQIRHLNADGKQVTLTVTKKSAGGIIPGPAPGQILGWTKLLCKSLDYDTFEQIFQATGPGELTLSDTQIKDTNEEGEQAVLGKKWWAKTYGFSDLQYLLSNNRIIANSESNKTISIQYVELVNGEYSSALMATAGHIEIQLKETGDGKLEPATVVASGGIDYKKDDDNRFLGSVLIYDHEKSLVTIRGDEKNPCYYNRLLVDEITIDLRSNSVKFESAGPSSL